MTVTEAPARPAPAARRGRVEAWLLAPAPPTRLATLRVLIGAYAVIHLLATTPSFLQVVDLPARQFDPVGLLSWMPSPLAPAAVAVVLGVTIGLGVALIVGWRWRIVAPAFALLYVLIGTYRVSWGHVSHGDHLPAIHLVLLALMPAADAWSLDARRRAAGEPAPASRYGWPVRVLAVATVVTYVLAGIAKLRYGGLGWIDGSVLRNQIAADTLQKILLGASHSPIGGWVASHPAILPAAAVGALAVELGAPVALLGGWWRNGWVAAAWLFHVSIAVVMAIGFPYPLYGVAFAPFFAVEEGVAAIRRWLDRHRPRRSAV